MNRIKLPTLMIQGGCDQVGCVRSAKAVYQSIPGPNKNIITYDDCDHYMLADGDWVDIIAKDSIGW